MSSESPNPAGNSSIEERLHELRMQREAQGAAQGGSSEGREDERDEPPRKLESSRDVLFAVWETILDAWKRVYAAVTKKVAYGSLKPGVREWREHCERIESLRFEKLSIEPGIEKAEDSRTMQQIGELYGKNLIPDDTFFLLLEDEDTRFPSGMFNHFQPSDDLLEVYRKYDPHYRTVRDQVFEDMKERRGYRFFALREKEEGPLVASLSIRCPRLGADTEDMDHAAYLRREVEASDQVRYLSTEDEQAVMSKLGRTIEIDTINADPGQEWDGAGRWLVLQSLRRLRQEQPAMAELPAVYYRIDGLKLREPRRTDFSPKGPHEASLRLFSGFGFHDFGVRSRESDVVVRDAPNAGIVVCQEVRHYGRVDTLERAIVRGEDYWRTYEGDMEKAIRLKKARSSNALLYF